MDKLIINGGIPLSGEVMISGAKNAVLPIMAATIITPGKYQLNNVPKLRDTSTMKSLLERVGAKVNFSYNIMDIDIFKLFMINFIFICTNYCDRIIL